MTTGAASPLSIPFAGGMPYGITGETPASFYDRARLPKKLAADLLVVCHTMSHQALETPPHHHLNHGFPQFLAQPFRVLRASPN